MIPVVDLSEADRLRQELVEHPLYQRRAEVQQAFLDDLTRLTRKYGLEVHADTRTEYGETYPDCELKTPYAGTEARYIISDYRGVDFESMKAKDALPCSDEERDAFKAAKAARREEDEIIGKLGRKISDAHWKAMEAGMDNMFERRMAEHADFKPVPACVCGTTFKSNKALQAHRAKTGHGA